MQTLLFVIAACALAACGAVVVLAFQQRREIGRLTAQRAADEAQLRELIVRSERAETELRAASEREAAAVEAERRAAEVRLQAAEELRRSELASLRESHEAQLAALRSRTAEERAAEQEERRRQEERIREQFRSLSAEILREQSQTFRRSNSESLELLLKPFRENIKSFGERVEHIHHAETEQQGRLMNELKHLMELNQRITAETTNLTRALKGNSKVQGDWGETLLDTILDNSGLTRGLHYELQYTTRSDEGAAQRPDVVLSLPEGKKIIIDAKVSLTAYVNYVAAEDEPARAAALRALVESVDRHIAELSRKDYPALFNLRSPEFVIMFIPNEPAFLAAMQQDNRLWQRAYEKRVVISSPTNLFALLKIVDDVWRRYTRTKNQEQVLELAGKIYDQVEKFMGGLTALGRDLDRARKTYDDTYKYYCTGNNNLVRLSQGMKKLGVKVRKELSEELVAMAETDLPGAPAGLAAQDPSAGDGAASSDGAGDASASGMAGSGADAAHADGGPETPGEQRSR